MHEWYEKYASYPRDVTLTTFDKPMLIFLGLTITDFVAGVSSFIALIMVWDSLLAIPVAICHRHFGVLAGKNSTESAARRVFLCTIAGRKD
jgi:hypothetical protein